MIKSVYPVNTRIRIGTEQCTT